MKKQILIIEDQLSTRKLLSHFLSNYYQVIETEDATEALTLLSNGFKPDVIVSDLIMPGTSGLEFLKQMKDLEFETIPVMMLSGVENSHEKMKCFNLGAKDYMVKPFNPAELQVRLSNMIAN